MSKSRNTIKVRRSWGDMNPATRRINNRKTNYVRKNKWGNRWDNQQD